MYAEVGDRIIVCSAEADGADHTGQIVEVRRSDGGPPYLVEWDDSVSDSLVYPGSNSFFMRGSHRSLV